MEHLLWADTFCQSCSGLTPGTLHSSSRRCRVGTQSSAEQLLIQSFYSCLHAIYSCLKLCVFLMIFKTKIDYTYKSAHSFNCPAWWIFRNLTHPSNPHPDQESEHAPCPSCTPPLLPGWTFFFKRVIAVYFFECVLGKIYKYNQTVKMTTLELSLPAMWVNGHLRKS